jgi:hypothetical protein
MHVDLQHSGSGNYCSTQTYRYCTSDQQATQSEFHLAAVVDGEVKSMPLEWRHFLLVAETLTPFAVSTPALIEPGATGDGPSQPLQLGKLRKQQHCQRRCVMPAVGFAKNAASSAAVTWTCKVLHVLHADQHTLCMCMCICMDIQFSYPRLQ